MFWFSHRYWNTFLVLFLLFNFTPCSLELAGRNGPKPREKPGLIRSMFRGLSEKRRNKQSQGPRSRRRPSRPGEQPRVSAVPLDNITRPWKGRTLAKGRDPLREKAKTSPLPSKSEDFYNLPDFHRFFEPADPSSTFIKPREPLSESLRPKGGTSAKEVNHQSEFVKLKYLPKPSSNSLGKPTSEDELEIQPHSGREPKNESFERTSGNGYAAPSYSQHYQKPAYTKPAYKPQPYLPPKHPKYHHAKAKVHVDFVPIFLAFVPICLCLGGIVAFSLLGSARSGTTTSSSPTIITIPVSTGTTGTTTTTGTNTTVVVNTTSTSTNPFLYCILPYLLNTTNSTSFFRQCLLLELFTSGSGSTSGFSSLLGGSSSNLLSILLLFPSLFSGFSGLNLFSGRAWNSYNTVFENDLKNVPNWPPLPPDLALARSQNLTFFDRTGHAVRSVLCFSVAKYPSVKDALDMVSQDLVNHCLYPTVTQTDLDWVYELNSVLSRPEFEDEAS